MTTTVRASELAAERRTGPERPTTAETGTERLRATYRVGDHVTTHTRSARWNQRTGRVTTTNAGEYGVTFTNSDTAEAWFKPAELRKERA